MRLFTRIVFLAVAAFTVYAADPEKKVVTPDTVAVSFVNAYNTGDVETLQSLSVVPFSMDGVIFRAEDRELVDEFLAGIVEDTSEEDSIYCAAKRADDVPSLDDKVFPEYVAFRLIIPGEGDYLGEIDMGMVIYISTGDEPKVIGFGFAFEE
jgi:hypothetical protein